MTKKKCSECGEVKGLEMFRVGRNQCKECVLASHKAWREANSDKVKASVKAWREANPDKQKARSKAWRDANSDKFRAKANENTKALSNSYVCMTLRLTKAQATPELIALKREQLQLTRLTREIKNERKSTINPS